MESSNGNSKPLRLAHPHVADMVDQLRSMLGKEHADRQIARGLRARKIYDQIKAEQGVQAAHRWHKANPNECAFWAKDGPVTFGLPYPSSSDDPPP